MLAEIQDALVIYNPASGRHRDRRLAEIEEASRILARSGIRTELAPTSARGEATTFARQAVAQGRQLVIVCGGDGTVNEAVNGLAGSSVPLAVLPAGTANILAKELRIPWDIAAAARLIPDSSLRRIALGLARRPGLVEKDARRYFLCAAGAGPDGAIVQTLENSAKKKTSIAQYWMEGFRQLFLYGFPEFRISSEGRDLDATLVVVGRTKHYGGPFRITTGASLYEDSFEIVANTSRSRWRYAICLPALWLNRLRSIRGIHFWKTVELRCVPASSATVFAQLDGEPFGALPLDFELVPDALTLVIPASAPPPGA